MKPNAEGCESGAYDRGEKACRDGWAFDTNPYMPATDAAGSWEAGWLDAHESSWRGCSTARHAGWGERPAEAETTPGPSRRRIEGVVRQVLTAVLVALVALLAVESARLAYQVWG